MCLFNISSHGPRMDSSHSQPPIVNIFRWCPWLLCQCLAERRPAIGWPNFPRLHQEGCIVSCTSASHLEPLVSPLESQPWMVLRWSWVRQADCQLPEPCCWRQELLSPGVRCTRMSPWHPMLMGSHQDRHAPGLPAQLSCPALQAPARSICSARLTSSPGDGNQLPAHLWQPLSCCLLILSIVCLLVVGCPWASWPCWSPRSSYWLSTEVSLSLPFSCYASLHHQGPDMLLVRASSPSRPLHPV